MSTLHSLDKSRRTKTSKLFNVCVSAALGAVCAPAVAGFPAAIAPGLPADAVVSTSATDAGTLAASATAAVTANAAAVARNKAAAANWNIPEGYLDEADNIPAFWVTTIEEVNEFLKNNVREGKVEQIGLSAGGRPLYAVSYGTPRTGRGTTTFSGSLGLRGGEGRAYRGQDSEKTVYVGMAGIHGFEIEGIMGVVNLISVFETGKDLNGQSWPELVALRDAVDRIVLLPLMGPDGRARVPVRMEKYRGESTDSYIPHLYLNTGGNKDGSLIGWPAVKAYIPMDFSAVGFPGGYPNDAGVNVMHDDFFGKPQPETQALFDLMEREKPDLMLSMHTGVWFRNYFMTLHRPFTEAKLQPVFDDIYRRTMTRLTREGLRGSADVALEADPSEMRQSGYNLNTALNLHSGVLCITVESPCHGYNGENLAGEKANQTPEKLLQAQLIAHQEALRFLAKKGGRSTWFAESPK